MPYVHRWFSAKEPYNQWLFWQKRHELKASYESSPHRTHPVYHAYFTRKNTYKSPYLYSYTRIHVYVYIYIYIYNTFTYIYTYMILIYMYESILLFLRFVYIHVYTGVLWTWNQVTWILLFWCFFLFGILSNLAMHTSLQRGGWGEGRLSAQI